MPLIRNYSLSLQPNKLKHYCGRERRTNFTRTYRRRRTSVRHRVQTILPGIVRLRLPICNSTRIRGDRTRVMMWLWENRCTLMEELTLKTLLFTIVKNKALNRLSHFEIKRKVHQEIVDKYDSEFNNPDFYLSDELFPFYMKKALKKNFRKEYLEAYEMNRNQHLTHKEIAEKLNVSPQTINYRIGQALKLLRVALKDYLPLFILIFGPNFFEQS